MIKLIKTPDNLEGKVTAADAAGLWKDTEVKSDNFDEKFEVVPSEFTVYGVMGAKIKFKDENNKDVVREGVPAFAISPDGSKYVLLSTFTSNYFSTIGKNDFVPTQITKEGANEKKYLIVNNKMVNSFAEGKSINELTAYVLNKKNFTSEAGKIYYKYVPKFTEGKPEFASKDLSGDNLRDELAKRVFAKKYVKISAKE